MTHKRPPKIILILSDYLYKIFEFISLTLKSWQEKKKRE